MAPSNKAKRLEQAVVALRLRHGQDMLAQAAERPRKLPPHIPSGFAKLDAITGCNGIPLHAITLLTGPTTSGKLTLAYKVLANAQRTSSARRLQVAILDLTLSADADYIARCSVDLEYTLFVRPPDPERTINMIFDLVREREYGLRVLLIDGLADLLRDHNIRRMFDTALPQLAVALKRLPCAVICLDEPRPPWLRWLRLPSSAIAHYAALHVELKREKWLQDPQNNAHAHPGSIMGYLAQAHIVQSEWARAGQTTPIAIEFNGTVKARDTW